MLNSFRITSRGFYSAKYYRQHCTVQTLNSLEHRYMHNPDDKHPTRRGFEPSTSEFRAITESKEASRPVNDIGNEMSV